MSTLRFQRLGNCLNYVLVDLRTPSGFIRHFLRSREGDRVEIYRPLIADPKEVRKQRAAQGKRMAKGGGDMKKTEAADKPAK